MVDSNNDNFNEVIKAQNSSLIQNIVRRIKDERNLEKQIEKLKNLYALSEVECEAIRTTMIQEIILQFTQAIHHFL